MCLYSCCSLIMEVQGSRVRMYAILYFGDPYLLTIERSPLVQSTLGVVSLRHRCSWG